MGNLGKTLLFTGLALCLCGCNLKVQSSTEEEDAQQKALEEALRQEVRIPVEAKTPSRSDVYAFFETTARVVAERRVEVVAQGVGECISIAVEEGDTVEAGDVLAELDKKELRAQMHQTEVTIDQQRAAYERARKALADNIGTPVEVENAKLALDQSEANLALQEVQLQNLTIKAPISGVVTTRAIQPGMMVTSGVPVFTIVDPTSFTLPIYLPERQLSKLHVGQEAQVRLDSTGDRVLTARVARVNPSVDPTTGTVKVTLNFDAETQDLLREAAFSRVKLIMDRRDDVLVVPKDSLIEENTRDYLMVVEEEIPEDAEEPVNVANRVEVETGLEDSDHIEIRSGITEDSLIVTLGQHTLKSGSEVLVTNLEAEINRNEGMTVQEGLDLAEKREELKEEERRKAEEEAKEKAESDAAGEDGETDESADAEA